MAEERDWSGLPFDVTVEVMKRLGTKDMVRAWHVCPNWHRAGSLLELFKVVHICSDGIPGENPEVLRELTREAIHLSGGLCEEITVRGFNIGDDFLNYLFVTCGCTGIRVLRLDNESLDSLGPLEDFVQSCNLLQLQELELSRFLFRRCIFRPLHYYCPNLKKLSINHCLPNLDKKLARQFAWEIAFIDQLEQLSLQGFTLSVNGVQYILWRNPGLKVLDLRSCRKVYPYGPQWRSIITAVPKVLLS